MTRVPDDASSSERAKSPVLRKAGFRTEERRAQPARRRRLDGMQATSCPVSTRRGTARHGEAAAHRNRGAGCCRARSGWASTDGAATVGERLLPAVTGAPSRVRLGAVRGTEPGSAAPSYRSPFLSHPQKGARIRSETAARHGPRGSARRGARDASHIVHADCGDGPKTGCACQALGTQMG